MKIVYCLLGTFNSGGMERVLANKANYLARAGNEVVIVTTDQQGRPSFFELDARIEQIDLGINYTANVGRNFLGKFWSYLFKRQQHQKKLKSLLEQLKADITVSMFDHDASFLFKSEDNSKKILEIHFSRYKRLQYGRKGVWKLLDVWLSRRDLKIARSYDRFVVLTQEDRGYWGDLVNIRVIPNAHSFNLDETAVLEKSNVVAVGRYDYQKGFDELIAIWSEVHRQHPDWQLSIYGNGPLKEEMKRQIAALGLEDSVRLCDPVKNIEQVYLQSALLLMTSRYEGLPMVLLEAQACGVPMVSYACKCGPKDIISDGENGYLIPEGERELFSQRIDALIRDVSLRKKMGQVAKLRSEGFSEDKVMEKWVELFTELTGVKK